MKAGRATKPLLALLCFLSSALGLGLIYLGVHQPPEALPQLQAPVSAPASQGPAGPRDFVLEGELVTAGKLPKEHLMLPAVRVLAPVTTRGQYGTFQDGQGLVLPEASQVTRAQAAGDGTTKQRVLMAGHVSWNGTHGALFPLAELKAGQRAYWRDARGVLRAYKLTQLIEYKKTVFPYGQLVKPQDGALVVVTCSGLEKVNGNWVYSQNLVAIFTPLALDQ